MTIPLLTSRKLASVGFSHAFSTREAGDFALGRAPEALRADQKRLAEGVGFQRDRLFQTTQVHGARLVEASERPETTVEADALAASNAGDAVAVRVADCVPVLLANPTTGQVAAVHAGWRGIEAGIVGVGVRRMGEVVAAIGPAIGACCFEVGIDVAERIAAVSAPDVIAWRKGDKAYVDLRRAVRAQLVLAGVKSSAIDDVPGCTSCDESFHSYRRDGEESGRLIAVIVAR